MVKKEIEIDEFEDEEDYDSELEDEEDKPIKKKEKKVKDKNWIIEHSPETWTVINPATKEIMAQAQDIELLRLQLQVISAQKASEASKQTE